MKTADIVKELGLKVICGNEFLGREVTGGYVSDLLSDVIGNAREGNIWITLQSHLNVVAVASLKELSAVIIVKGAMPVQEAVEKSISEEIPLLSAETGTFEVSGRLYELLNRK